MTATASSPYLPAGLPAPVVEPDGLSKPYRDGLAQQELHIQRCGACHSWQWGPEWICHVCHSFDMRWERVAPRGRIYSWARCWHPVHPALKEHGPYLAVLVELPQANNIRMLGNLLGDPHQPVEIGAEVEAVFEHHPGASIPYSLAHWRVV
jgi:uncharacterized OB-fold protein